MRKIPRWYRRWARQQRKLKKSLFNTYIHRILGERVFMAEIWRMDRFRLANGLTLGLFIAFTPTIPFQMLLCVIGAIILHVNLPIALAACWITNPVTAIPIFVAAHKLGRRVLANTSVEAYTLELFDLYGQTGAVIRESLYLWTGSLIFALIAAALGNGIIHAVYKLNRIIREKRHGKDTRPGEKSPRIEW